MNNQEDTTASASVEDAAASVGWDGTTFGIVPHWLLGQVKPSAIVVYLALTTWADNTDGRAFPGLSGVADKAGLSLATVRSGIKELEAVGAVRVEARFRPDGSQTSNNYWLRTTPPQPSQPPTDSVGAPPHRKRKANELDPQRTKPSDTPLRSVSPRSPGEPPLIRYAQQAADRLAVLIENNGSRRPTITDAWLLDLERMHRIDGRTWDEIAGAIEWSQRHEFWASVILSPKKLRAKFDQMRLQATREQRRANPTRDAYEKFMSDDMEGLL